MVENHRLVTLTGPSGIGKTHLAIEVAEAATDRWGDAVFVMELDVVPEPDLVVPAVATTVGVGQSQAGEDPISDLVTKLRGMQGLLVIDNCEHLVDACAELVGAILSDCLHLHVLATSQQPLGLPDERVWPVPPLSLPASGAPSSDASWEELEQARSSEAVQLFCARAVSAVGTFVLDEQNVSAVVEICRRLEGIPLAIELAAARVQVLSVHQIVPRLDNRFALVAGVARAGSGRHGTLRAALDWSHDLLSEPEAALLARLSVFAGSATLDAIADVCASDPVPADTHALLELLDGLVAKSLLAADMSAAVPRHRLTDTVRDYARECLARRGEVDSTHHRLIEWCVRLADCGTDPHLHGAPEPTWLDQVEDQHANMVAALEWALDQNSEMTIRLAAALGPFWAERGYLQQGRRWLKAALAAPHVDGSRARALRSAAMLELMGGDFDKFDKARGLLEEALGESGGSGDTLGCAAALNGLGLVAALRGDQPTARALLGQGEVIARESGDSRMLVNSLLISSEARLIGGDSAGARPLLEECLEVAAETGGRHLAVRALGGLGWALLAEGDYESAERVLSAAMDDAGRSGPGPAMARSVVARVARLRGNYEKSRALAEEGLSMSRELKAAFLLQRCLLERGRLAYDEGDFRTARELFEEALTVKSGRGPGSVRSGVLLALARVRAAIGDVAGARTLLEEAAAVIAESDKAETAALRFEKGELARRDANHTDAFDLYKQALTLFKEAGDPIGIVNCLEALAHLAMAAGLHDRAVRILGAAHALRTAPRLGYVRPPVDRSLYDSNISFLRGSMVGESFESAWAEGSAMSVDRAVTYALRGRGSRQRPAKGWASLSPAEQQVADLVAKRMTNMEIAEKLFVSPRTVQSHLRHAFAKLAVSSRRELRDLTDRRRPPADQ